MDDGRPDAAPRHTASENPSDTTSLAQAPSAMQAAVVGANVLRKPPAGKSALVSIDAAKPIVFEFNPLDVSAQRTGDTVVFMFPDGAELQIMTFQKNEVATKPVSVDTGVTYSYRVRSERLGSGTARFTVKVWPTGTSELSATSLTYDLAERAGSVLLVAHHADVTFRKLDVKPVN